MSAWPWIVGGGAVVGWLLARSSSAEGATDSAQTGHTDGVTPPAATIPPAPSSRETGAQFAARIARGNEAAREIAILDAVQRGNVPASLRAYRPVQLSARGHTGTAYVAPDYLAIGIDWSDALRVPLSARGAQRAVDLLGAVLPTKRLVDAIHAQAGVHVPFDAFAPNAGESRNSVRLWVASNARVEARRAGRNGLLEDAKKSIVVGQALARHPQNVVIYGGWYANGERVQAENGSSHSGSYRDYSHGVRPIHPMMIADGVQRQVVDVLADPELAWLLSDEGAVAASGRRYD